MRTMDDWQEAHGQVPKVRCNRRQAPAEGLLMRLLELAVFVAVLTVMLYAYATGWQGWGMR